MPRMGSVKEIGVVTALMLVVGMFVAFTPSPQPVAAHAAEMSVMQAAPAQRDWVVLAWNDLGMHCYNSDFQNLAVLPPFNTLWAQVVKVGNPPEIVTEGIEVSYEFPDNKESASKTNFWDYDLILFGKDLPLNVGLAGKGLAGKMDPEEDHFVVEGIPLTEFSDSNPTVADPYQMATIVVRDSTTGEELARTVTVAPVSSEMHCDNCHYDGGVEGIRTGNVETNILTLHDKENADEYPAGSRTPLMDRRPVLCAECHSSNALGAPGKPDIPSLSRAMHEKHKDAESSAEDDDHHDEGRPPGNETDPNVDLALLAAAMDVVPVDNFCYNCHPGPETKCLRDVMSARGMTCTDCHGDMEKVASNPNPWLNEPRCDGCHDEAGTDQNHALYRMSTGHGGVYCAGCHDSPHAIAPSTQPKDGIKFVDLQGHTGTLTTCTVCHSSDPTEQGPHEIPAASRLSNRIFLPATLRP